MSIRKGTKLISGLPENIQSIYNQNNADIGLRFWSGTQDEYKAITVKDSNTVYNVIDDSSEPQKLSTINPFDFGDSKYTSIPIANASWLKSEGQWNSGNTYLDFYEWVVEKAINHEEGFKLSSETYTDYDFVVNTSDTTFRLPLKSKLASGKTVVGNGMSLGLTDGIYPAGLNQTSVRGNIAINDGTSVSLPNHDSNLVSTGMTAGAILGVTTDATKSGIETDTTGLYLYYYVGDTIQDSKLINMSNVLNEIADIKSNIIIEEYVNGTSGYRIWASGYCEQWGVQNAVGSYGVVTINLLKEYENTDYVVLGSINWGNEWYTSGAGATLNGVTDVVGMAGIRTTKSFIIQRFSRHSWFTFGKLKEGEY